MCIQLHEAAITGSCLAGVLFGRTEFRSRINQGIHPLTYSMLVPIYLVAIGLQANIRALGGQEMFTVILVAVAIVAKAVGLGSRRSWVSPARNPFAWVGGPPEGTDHFTRRPVSFPSEQKAAQLASGDETGLRR